MGVTLSQVREIVERVSVENGIPIPNDFQYDCETHLGIHGEISNFHQLQSKICTKIRQILAASPALKARYSHFIKSILDDVRIAIARLLGFEEIVQASEKRAPPIKEILGLIEKSLWLQ